MPETEVIRAAGVVLLRQADPTPEVLIVHRPEYGEWSLPKGKLEPGEHPILAAIRECDEETGYQAVLGARLPSLRYPVEGIPKVVDFWAARVSGDEGFIPGSEIDDIRWLPIDQARHELNYSSEADLVECARLPVGQAEPQPNHAGLALGQRLQNRLQLVLQQGEGDRIDGHIEGVGEIALHIGAAE